MPIETSGQPNANGGSTRFGNLIECEGGNGASGLLCTSYPLIAGNSSKPNNAIGGNILNFGGSDGDDFFALSATISSAGVGACNPLSGAVVNRVTVVRATTQQYKITDMVQRAAVP